MRSRRAWSRCRLRRIERAIELNGVAVEANLQAFAFGRLAAHDRAVDALVRQRADDAARAAGLAPSSSAAPRC